MFSKIVILYLGIIFFNPPAARAKVFITLQEALDQSFPAEKKCESKAENKYLTKAQSDHAKELSGYDTASALIVRYPLTCAGKLQAYAYTDTHRVRTHMETLFFLVDLNGKIEKIEVLSFDEPLDYIPKSSGTKHSTKSGSAPPCKSKEISRL